MNEIEFDMNVVERDERWLKEVLEPAREIGTAAVKHRVRIAVQEEWLRAQLGSADCGNSIARTRKTVRAAVGHAADSEVSQSGIHEPAREVSPIRVINWLRIGLAVAAVLTIAILLPRFVGTGIGGNAGDGGATRPDRIATGAGAANAEGSGDSALRVADLAAWSGTADEDSANELDQEIESLREEFDSANDAIAQGWWSDAADWDDAIDENSAEGS